MSLCQTFDLRHAARVQVGCIVVVPLSPAHLKHIRAIPRRVGTATQQTTVNPSSSNNRLQCHLIRLITARILAISMCQYSLTNIKTTVCKHLPLQRDMPRLKDRQLSHPFTALQSFLQVKQGRALSAILLRYPMVPSNPFPVRRTVDGQDDLCRTPSLYFSPECIMFEFSLFIYQTSITRVFSCTMLSALQYYAFDSTRTISDGAIRNLMKAFINLYISSRQRKVISR